VSNSIGSERALTVLGGIATEFSALTLSLPKFLDRVLSVLGQGLGFDHCMVALQEEKGVGRLVVRAATGLAAPQLGTVLPVGVHESVMASGEATAVPGLRAAGPHAGSDLCSCICIPIVLYGRAIGVVYAYRPAPGAFSEQDLNLMVDVARYLASAIQLARLHEHPPARAHADPLTDLPTEPVFCKALDGEIRRGHRYEQPLAVLCVDVDRREAIRERHGEASGHAALRTLAKTLRAMFRESDVVARAESGFLILLPHTPKRAAVSVAERIRQRARTIAVNAGPPITVSIGVAEAPRDSSTGEELLAAARRALDEAKRGGGDRVEASGRAASPRPARM
jgi:diguanylate cyclase (GGDEF)-like protein